MIAGLVSVVLEGLLFLMLSSSSRSIALLDDKEYGTDLTHCRQQLLSQKHVAVVCATDPALMNVRSVWTHPWTPSLTYSLAEH